MNPDNKRTGTIKNIGKYVYWKHKSLWIGYFKEYPEYWSQGETVAELAPQYFDLDRHVVRTTERKGYD